MIPSAIISPETNDVEAGLSNAITLEQASQITAVPNPPIGEIPDSPSASESTTRNSFKEKTARSIHKTQSSIRKVLQPDETVHEDWDSGGDKSRKMLFYFDKLLNDMRGQDEEQENNLTYRIKKKVNPNAKVIDEVEFSQQEETLYYSYMCLQSIRRLRRILVYLSNIMSSYFTIRLPNRLGIL